MLFNRFFFLIIIFSIYSNLCYGDITGNYKCSYYDPKKNSNIEQTLTISKTSETYRLQYYPINSVVSEFLGTGILKDNILASIDWNAATEWVGASLFAVKENDILEGTWATLNSNVTGTITCKKI